MSPRKAASPKPAVAVPAVLPEGAPASTVPFAPSRGGPDAWVGSGTGPGSAAAELIGAAFAELMADDPATAIVAGLLYDEHAKPLDEPIPEAVAAVRRFEELSAGAIVTLEEFLAREKGVAFAEVETPIAIVTTAINALRGQLPVLCGTPDVAQLRRENLTMAETLRVGEEHGRAVRVWLRDHYGIDPGKIGTAPLLAGAIINQFRSLEQQLAKALGKGS